MTITLLQIWFSCKTVSLLGTIDVLKRVAVPGLPEVHEGFWGGHVLLLHQVGGNDGRGARVAQEAVDEDEAVGKAQGAVDEFNRLFEKLKIKHNIGMLSFMKDL